MSSPPLRHDATPPLQQREAASNASDASDDLAVREKALRARLRVFYSTHDVTRSLAARTKEIDDLARFAALNGEESLNAALHAKYGDDISPSGVHYPVAAAAREGDDDDARSIATVPVSYQHADVHTLPVALAVPASPKSIKTGGKRRGGDKRAEIVFQLQQFYTLVQPERLQPSDQSRFDRVVQYAVDFGVRKLNESLRTKYGKDLNDLASMAVRSRAGTSDESEELGRSQYIGGERSQYGYSEDTGSFLDDGPALPEKERLVIRERLTRFYMAYAPAKLGKDNEDKFAQVVQYGLDNGLAALNAKLRKFYDHDFDSLNNEAAGETPAVLLPSRSTTPPVLPPRTLKKNSVQVHLVLAATGKVIKTDMASDVVGLARLLEAAARELHADSDELELCHVRKDNGALAVVASDDEVADVVAAARQENTQNAVVKFLVRDAGLDVAEPNF